MAVNQKSDFYQWVVAYRENQYANLDYWTQQEQTLKTKNHVKKIELVINTLDEILGDFSMDCEINRMVSESESMLSPASTEGEGLKAIEQAQ